MGGKCGSNDGGDKGSGTRHCMLKSGLNGGTAKVLNATEAVLHALVKDHSNDVVLLKCCQIIQDTP